VSGFSRTWPQPAHKSRARRVASNLWCRSERVIEIVVSDLPAQVHTGFTRSVFPW